MGLDPSAEAQQSYSYGQKHQSAWLENFQLYDDNNNEQDTYTNKNVVVHKKGVEKMIEIIMQSQEIVTLICIGINKMRMLLTCKDH